MPRGSLIGRWTISIGIGPLTYLLKYPLYASGFRLHQVGCVTRERGVHLGFTLRWESETPKSCADVRRTVAECRCERSARKNGLRGSAETRRSYVSSSMSYITNSNNNNNLDCPSLL